MGIGGCCGKSAPRESVHLRVNTKLAYEVKSPYFLLERLPFVKGQAVGLGDDRNDVYDLAELLHDSDIDSSEGVACGVDEVQTAMDASVLDETITHGGKLLAEVRAVLVLYVLHDRIPTIHEREWGARLLVTENHAPVVVVHLVSIPRGIDNIEPKLNTILDNH